MASASSAPTAAPWVHFTSSVRISRCGRVSISAWSESSRFLLVWLASVPGASGRTTIRPLNTPWPWSVAMPL